jgi:hypothetical protein
MTTILPYCRDAVFDAAGACVRSPFYVAFSLWRQGRCAVPMVSADCPFGPIGFAN